MLTALTRKPAATLGRCELTFVERQPIDPALALGQHEAYERALADCGVRVVSLPADAEHPDSVFVEDAAMVLDEVAIIARPGVESRRQETAGIAEALARYRELRYIGEPATIEGGDVFRLGRTLYVGLSRRTNAAGIEQLAASVETFGYRVVPIAVSGCLHLKTACCPLPGGELLVNPNWIDGAPLKVWQISVPEKEPWGANVLCIDDTVLAPASAPLTCELLQRSGYRVRVLDIGELQKAEAGMTCMSILF